MRVVVVDDEEDIRFLLRITLPRGGIEVVGEAADAQSGLAEIASAVPDAVVLDLHMPDVAVGVQTVARIHDSFPGTRVVVYTADPSEGVRDQALANGAAAVVAKQAVAGGLIDALTAPAVGTPWGGAPHGLGPGRDRGRPKG